jgi:acyl dehydratase
LPDGLTHPSARSENLIVAEHYNKQIGQKVAMPQCVIEGLDELRRRVGQEVAVGEWFDVSQSLIDSFAALTGDRQWIHIDARRAAAESPYGTTIAHGLLTLSLISQMHAQAVQIRGDYTRAINYGFNRVRFPAAVKAGAKIRIHSTLGAIDEVEGGVQLSWDVVFEIEGQAKPALAAQWLVRHYR